ncbi:hypothetical protein IAT38_002381 [Cryptococcus sp. DSM 104549]
MALKSRRPALPTLAMPAKQQASHEDVHTPLPFTPVPFEQGPLVMTPDTATFDLSPLEVVLSGAKRPFGGEGLEFSEDLAWTDYEDGLLQSYLAHPPRALATSYPPGTLPPPGALDEITSQLIDAQARKSSPVESPESEDPSIIALPTWRHSWKATRQRLFTIARLESIESTGGHRRQKSDSIVPPEAGDAVMTSEKPKWMALGAVDGGFSMNRRQNNSMDSLYGDSKPDGFSEALRLSSSLQCSAAGGSSSLSSGSGLDSPLHGTFNFNPTRKPFPFTASTSHMPRPASLLQRGRSFTSEDFAREYGRIDDGDDSDSSASTSQSRPRAFTSPRTRAHRSASSPISAPFSSPPTSVSSTASDCDAAPITPLHQETFGAILGSECSTPMAEVPPVPAVTLTVGSPERRSSGAGEVLLPEANSDSPSKAFASLSLSSRSISNSSLSSSSSSSTITPTLASAPILSAGPTLPELPPHVIRPPLTSTTSLTHTPVSSSSSSFSLVTKLGRGKVPRPLPLTRSKSDSSPFGKFSMTSITSLSGDRDAKRQKGVGLGCTGGLKGEAGLAPSPKGLNFGDELASPFQIKRAL